MLKIKKTDNIKGWWGYRAKEHSDIAGGNVRWYNHFGKQDWQIIIKLKIYFSPHLAFYSQILIPKRSGNFVNEY